MANIDNHSPNITDDERPIAARGKRWCSSIRNSSSRSTHSRPYGISTPPETPKRAKKRVRFSDPAPLLEASFPSGLTPFIRRTTLSTPTRNRRHSTPPRLWNPEPVSGTLQFEPLRQVLDGRVKRRLRRNRLSEEVNNIQGDKRHESKARRSEVEHLRAELAAKDLEAQRMRDEHDIGSHIEEESGTPTMTLSTKVQELEQQIVDLKAELQEKEMGGTPDWTSAAKDPFTLVTAGDGDEVQYEYDQEDLMVGAELMNSPILLNTSIPSPPSSMPNTPCRSSRSVHMATQVSFPDPESDHLRSQLQCLRSEVIKLKSIVALKDDKQSRLIAKLSQFVFVDEPYDQSILDSALDTVLAKLALSETLALEKENAFSALAAEVTTLGVSTGPEETLQILAQQFRQARLELEYATPGEVIEGFENSKLLEMLVSRVRILVERVKERDNTIDQYHNQEILLRQQINSRVDAQHDVQKELSLANSVVQELRAEVGEVAVSNERLQRALDGYRAEVIGLETLIERMEAEGRKKEKLLRAQATEAGDRLQDEMLKHDTTRASEEGKDFMLIQLERRLGAALDTATEVQVHMAELSTYTRATIAAKEATIEQLMSASKTHGDALALQDARVSELSEEVELVNKALKTAHSTILSLRKDNQMLAAHVEGETTRGQAVVRSMQEQLSHVLETGLGYVNAERPSRREGSAPPAINDATPQAVIRRGRFLDGGLARRSSGKKRRRYDSGLGSLGEQDEESVILGVEI